MRHSVVLLSLFIGGCGADVNYGGGMLSDEAQTGPDGQHTTYIDPPNYSRTGPSLWNEPQPASAIMPPDEPNRDNRGNR